MKFVLLLGLATALLGIGASSAATQKAQVVLVNRAPVTVRGIGFHQSERVVVTVSAMRLETKKVYATARGAFRVVFKGYSFVNCEPYSIRAKGNRGSTVFVRVLPECASQGPSG